ncbi:MAG: TlpA family protein disulfide reductase [Solirubrobacteraceae bacterium]
MTAIVSVETVLLVILVVLVAGLLRSHAEILRRLGPEGPEGGERRAAAPSAPRRLAGAPAAPIAGSTPHGDAVALDLSVPGTPTLLAFLSSGCSTCAGFWASLAQARLPAGVDTVVITHGPERERVPRLLELAPAGVPVVMSSRAWVDYVVPGSPYFVLVDGTIRGEGVATTWPALSSLVADAVADAGIAPGRADGTVRAHAVDRTLAAAGIGPDHPSLYPAGADGATRTGSPAR